MKIETYNDLKLALADNAKIKKDLEDKHQELIELRNSRFKEEFFAEVKQECLNVPEFPFTN